MIGEMCKSPHLNEMINLKNQKECFVYAEIGVLYGGSLIEQMKSDKKCFFIGIPEVMNLLDDKKIDFLFIDGDHSYQGVIDDFMNYKDMISDDGVLVFDNYKDPNWKDVETAVKDIIRDNNDYMIQNEFGHCCVISKK